MITTIRADVPAHLVVSRDSPVPLRMTLRYEPSDPYAVRAVFHIGEERTVEWVFARELLADGLDRPAGEGDVHVWPTPESRPKAVRIALVSPTGAAVLEAPARQVVSFLERTNVAVPPGAELEHLDMDSELALILADG